ncbi:hypothetical protein PGAL8A_00273200 [Plasmodium gallinaceum]|uniref:Gametocyte associated protein n=1 Tax=Plasmodium gallinaceum TaxID=5849 RepID=A0A1J1GWY7_PLAGA|nr:hypothetical protein PGAL8A_00273200 [Plasmodium gallinaceum]CRG95535.1 hypothetical protein PGAL8A_00273200 [Plasmodium gallinaceum]
MKNLKIFYFFNIFFLTSLPIILLFNTNIFEGLGEERLQRKYPKLWNVIERNLSQASASGTSTQRDSDAIRKRLNAICDSLHMGYMDITHWLTKPNDPLFSSYVNDGLKIADTIFLRVKSLLSNPSYNLIRHETARAQERNALVTSLGRSRRSILYMIKIFEMENEITKDLLHIMVGKTQNELKILIENNDRTSGEIKSELLKRNLHLPDVHLERMILRINWRAHDLALEGGILDDPIPEPLDCYPSDFSS